MIVTFEIQCDIGEKNLGLSQIGWLRLELAQRLRIRAFGMPLYRLSVRLAWFQKFSIPLM